MCDVHVPQFGGQPPGAEEQASVGDDAPADSGADREVDQVLAASAGAMLPFSQRGEIRVVPQRDETLEVVREDLLQRDVHPTGQVRRFEHDPQSRVEETGHPDANSQLAAVSGRDLFDALDQTRDDCVRTFDGSCRGFLNLGRFWNGLGVVRGPQVRAAEIYRDQGWGHGGSIAYLLED